MSELLEDGPLSLSKLVISGFIHFKHVEIDFIKFTSINGKSQIAALSSIGEALKFVLDCSRHPLNKLKCLSDDNDETPTFVEAFVTYPDGSNQTFRKTVIQNQIIYSIGGLAVTKEKYQEELFTSKILTQNFNTMFIDPPRINKISILTDEQRADFIEHMCSSKQLVASYKELSEQINHARLELDASVRSETTLLVEKKKLKKESIDIKKRSDLLQELDSQAMQHDLFKLYHNNKFLETANDNVEERTNSLQDAKTKLIDFLDEIEDCVQRKCASKNGKDKLKVQFDEINDEVWDLQEKCSDDWLYVKQQNDFKRDIDEEVNKLDREINIIRERTLKLSNQNDDNEKLHEEYEQLKRDFELSNRLLLLQHLSWKSIAAEDDVEYLNENIDRIFESRKTVQEAMNAIRQKIENLEEERHGKELAKIVIEHELAEMKEIEGKYKKLKGKLELAKGKKSDQFSKAKILDELKLEFGKKIVGRVSQLWEPATGADENLVKARLGEYSQAIVVDNRATAEQCIAFLKIKQLTSINEIFLPLRELSHQKDSKSFMSSNSIPTSIPSDVIENLFKAKTEDIKKAILFCIGPTLVLKSLSDAEIALKWPDSKQITVASSDAGTFFRSQGFLERNVLDELDAMDDDEIINLNEQILVDEYEKLVRMKLEVNKKKSQHKIIEYEIAFFCRQIQRLEIELDLKEQEDLFHEAKVKSLKNQLKMIEDNQSRRTVLLQYSCVKAELEEKNFLHYKEFCDKIGVESVKEYLKQRSEWLPTELIKREAEALEESIKSLEIQKAITQRSNINELVVDEAFSQALQVKEAEMIQLAEQCIAKEREHCELEKEHYSKQKIVEELTQQVIKCNEIIYDDLHRVQQCLKENYDTITRNFNSQSSIPLKEDTLVDFIITPADVPVDYETVRDSLKLVEVNFDRLKKSLKETVDIVEKTAELETKLDKLNSNIDSLSGKIQFEPNEEQARHISAEYYAISRVVASQKEKLKNIDEKLKEVKTERKKNFEEALEIINGHLAEFRDLTFGVRASLESMNKDEPYLGDVIYNWATNQYPNGKVTSANHLSSLMLLMAVIKFKKQEFVVLNNATANIVKEVSNLLENINGVQVVSLSSQSQDDCHYIIRSKSKTFTVVKMK